MKKSENKNEMAIDDTSNERGDDCHFSLEKDQEYCNFCQETYTWSAGAYHYKCWIR